MPWVDRALVAIEGDCVTFVEAVGTERHDPRPEIDAKRGAVDEADHSELARDHRGVWCAHPGR